MSLTCAEICALALSLMSLSIALYFLILSISALAKSLSDNPHGVTNLCSDFLPTKNCAAVDPLSIAGVLLYRVSVATSSFLWCMLRVGFGDKRRFLKLTPDTAPRVPSCVVASKVRHMLSKFAPGKKQAYLLKSLLLGLRSFGCLMDRALLFPVRISDFLLMADPTISIAGSAVFLCWLRV